MKQVARLAGILPCLLWSTGALAENSVVIESKGVMPNAIGVTIGIRITNDVGVVGAVFPIELRTASGGAFWQTVFTVAIPPSHRMGASPLAGANNPGNPGGWPAANITNKKYDVASLNCSSPGRNSYNVGGQVFASSPDAFLHATVSTGNPAVGEDIDMDPGSDPSFAEASIIVTINANGKVGGFVIDTCCVRPANHLAFVDRNTQLIAPSFTMGVVTICDCTCYGDPVCDKITNIQDVVAIINVAFRGRTSTTEPACAFARTDMDCNNVTDIVDVVRAVDVAFKGVPGPLQTCATCAQ